MASGDTKDTRWVGLPYTDAAWRLVRDLFQAVFQRLDALDVSGAGTTAPDGSITTPKLANGAATTIKIGSLAITLAKLGTDVRAYLAGAPGFTVGTEAANVINVAVQLKDYSGTALSGARLCRVWLSDTAGAAVTATAPNGGVAVGTAGVIVQSVQANKQWLVATSSTGAFDLNLTDSGTPTFYLNAEHDGRLYSSGAITFS